MQTNHTLSYFKKKLHFFSSHFCKQQFSLLWSVNRQIEQRAECVPIEYLALCLEPVAENTWL